MDEGLTTFVQYLAEQEFGEKYPDAIYPNKNFPSDRGPANMITDYMSVDQNYLAPIMSNPENVYSLGPNAYGKPATALNILRETIMGKELFDYAFKTYSQRWMFKHPTPEDFFRTMEDASAVDLDWFWRGWFYTTDYVDISIKELANLIAEIIGYKGSILWDEFKKDGTPKKQLDVSQIKSLGWSAAIDLDKGIEMVLREFKENQF